MPRSRKKNDTPLTHHTSKKIRASKKEMPKLKARLKRNLSKNTQHVHADQFSAARPKIIVIVGPTASGKSDLAVEVAQQFNCEVVSADSRQVYKGLNIGTGKITKEEMKGVSHHMLDVVTPNRTFTAQNYKAKAEQAIAKILKKGKTPVICGGTGFYIQTLVDNIHLPEVPPNKKLRKTLESKTALELFTMLVMIDPKRAATIDPNNPHRLIRAIEIAQAHGHVPEIIANPQYDPLFIGIETDDETLKHRINVRLKQRMEHGMSEEAEQLHKKGLSWERMEELGLEYKYLSYLLTDKITKSEFFEQMLNQIWHYAKRQKTWFKRDERIHWFNLNQKNELFSAIQKFTQK